MQQGEKFPGMWVGEGDAHFADVDAETAGDGLTQYTNTLFF
jgi:hypothetical protein